MNKINVNGKEVVLDLDALAFDEVNLSEWLNKAGASYAYYSSMLAIAENEYEVKFNAKFIEYKDQGGTDKLAESRAKVDEDVAQARLNYKLLQQYVRAWDKAHSAAQSRSYYLRQEMNKLNFGMPFNKPDDDNIEDMIKAIRNND